MRSGFLLEDETLRGDLRGVAAAAPDIARAISPLALQRGGPRDLGCRARRAGDRSRCARCCRGRRRHRSAGGARRHRQRLAGCGATLPSLLTRALVDDPPHQRRDGGFVRAGFRADLDEARSLRDDSRKVMAALEAKYLEETGIRSLKVRHNNILGFYIEVPDAQSKALLSEPLAHTFRHRQTMAGAVRLPRRSW
jgi:DNA mismatch repair protein MutS